MIGEEIGAFKTFKESPATFSVIALDIATQNNKNMLSIVNGALSPMLVRLISVKIINSKTAATAGAIIQFNIIRITGVNAGTTLTAKAADLNDALNANIVCKESGAVLGKEAAPIFRYAWYGDDYALGALDSNNYQLGIQNVHPIYAPKDGEKPITLRAGQGVMVECSSVSVVGEFDIEFIFTQERI